MRHGAALSVRTDRRAASCAFRKVRAAGTNRAPAGVQSRPVALAGQEGDAQFPLEPGHLRTDRGLGDEERFRRRRERALVENSQEVPHAAHFHEGCLLPPLTYR